MAKLRMVGGDFTLAAAIEWRILAKAVGRINDAKCLELVDSCRRSVNREIAAFTNACSCKKNALAEVWLPNPLCYRRCNFKIIIRNGFPVSGMPVELD